MKALLLIPLAALLFLSSCAMNTGKFVAEEKQSRLPDLYERDQYNRLVFFYPEADTPG